MRCCLALVVVFGLMCCEADASVLASLLTDDGNVDTMNDNSRAVVFDRNGNDLLDTGDEIVGILQFERVNDVDPSPAGLFSIFAFRVTGEWSFGAGAVIREHGAIPGGEAHSLRSLLDPALHPSEDAFNDWDNAMFAFVEIAALGANDPKDPFSPVNSDPADDPLEIITNVLSAANGYSLDAMVGFGHVDDFLTTMPYPFADAMIGDGLSPLLISEIKSDDSGQGVFFQSAGMSVLYDAMGYAGLAKLGIRKPGPITTPITYHDIILSPDGSVQTSTAEVPNWDFEDDTNFKINPVPEPCGMVLVISLVAALGIFRIGRRG